MDWLTHAYSHRWKLDGWNPVLSPINVSVLAKMDEIDKACNSVIIVWEHLCLWHFLIWKAVDTCYKNNFLLVPGISIRKKQLFLICSRFNHIGNIITTNLSAGCMQVARRKAIWALRAAETLFHGKWTRTYFESHAWREQHTVAPLFHMWPQFTRCDEIPAECSLNKWFHEIFMSFVERVNRRVS